MTHVYQTAGAYPVAQVQRKAGKKTFAEAHPRFSACLYMLLGMPAVSLLALFTVTPLILFPIACICGWL